MFCSWAGGADVWRHGEAEPGSAVAREDVAPIGDKSQGRCRGRGKYPMGRLVAKQLAKVEIACCGRQ